MDHGGLETDYTTMPVPGKVGAAQLHFHFMEKYEMDEEQAEALVASSSRSLNEFFSGADSLLNKRIQAIEEDEVKALAHRGKGLFLIMGQDEWALYVAALSGSSKNTIHDNLRMLVKYIRQSFSDIILIG
ncbi:MAG: hypothetical protein ACI8ZB_002299 [Desulforhopalus sp.]|jgi:hypothetical protein